MKALDIARTQDGDIVLITQVGGQTMSASVEYIGPNKGIKSAWFESDELEVIDSLPRLLARVATHVGGSGYPIPADYFGDERTVKE